MADSNDTTEILSAIGALGEQLVGLKTDVAELKKTDKDLASEVHRLGEEQRKHGRELQELRAETLRTFESERHASTQTVQAITKHVDEAAQAFHAKADKIDAIETETLKQSKVLEKQSNKMNIDAKGFWAFVHNTTVQDVAKLATLAAALYAAWKGIK